MRSERCGARLRLLGMEPALGRFIGPQDTAVAVVSYAWWNRYNLDRGILGRHLRYLNENWVAPRYFETLGTPLVAGGDFSFHDVGGPRVAIVNLAMARHYFGNDKPYGTGGCVDRAGAADRDIVQLVRRARRTARGDRVIWIARVHGGAAVSVAFISAFIGYTRLAWCTR